MYLFNGHFGILRLLGILDHNVVYSAVIWYILSYFGMLHREKSCNPGSGERFPPVFHQNETETRQLPIVEVSSVASKRVSRAKQIDRNVENSCRRQGDQVGRIFTYWVVLLFGQFI
jgi:hypothetical protein